MFIYLTKIQNQQFTNTRSEAQSIQDTFNYNLIITKIIIRTSLFILTSAILNSTSVFV